jgi:hypothetical protein
MRLLFLIVIFLRLRFQIFILMEYREIKVAVIKKLSFILFILFLPGVAICAPVILYTDLTHGPTDVGESSNGTYLSIFGTGFGTNSGSANVHINDDGGGWEAVATIKQWHNSNASNANHNGRVDIGIITVQFGSGVTVGGAIRVTDSSGVTSNTDHTFTVISGNIYFVDYTDGDDGTAVVNDITKPYASPSVPMDNTEPGDTIVIRAETKTCTTECIDAERFDGGNGSGGSGLPLAIIGYPGEVVTFRPDSGQYAIYYQRTENTGYNVIANLVLDINSGNDAAIYGLGDNSRFVNNLLHNMNGGGGGTGAIAGEWDDSVILGNTIHDIGHNKYYHAIYFAYNTSKNTTNEIAFNHIYNVWGDPGDANPYGGNGIQIYEGGDNTYKFWGYSIHDNIIHDVGKKCLGSDNDADGPWEVYNNVCYNTGNDAGSPDGESAFQFEADDFTGKVYNNTIYNVNDGYCFKVGNVNTGAELKNNICDTDDSNQNDYLEGAGTNWTIANNLWDGDGSAPAEDSDPKTGDPLYVDTSNSLSPLTLPDLSVQEASPAVNDGLSLSWTGTEREFLGLTRPQGVSWDIGAYEYGPSPVNPSLTSATISDITTLTLAFNENVTQGAGYADSDWDIDCTTGGNNISIAYSSGDGTTSHVYIISQVIYNGDSCNVDFNGDVNSEEDGDGNDLAAIVSDTVTNNSNMHKIAEGMTISRR